MTARLPTTTADVRRAAVRPIPADSRAFATATALITPQPHRRTTDGTRADADVTSVNDEGPPNNKEPHR